MSASRMGPRGNRRNADGKFLTDTDISHAAPKTERTLQAWTDDGQEDMANDVAAMTLEDSSDGKGWNQFTVNQKKFGVVPTYDEKMYTTEIDVSHPDFAAREKRAAQIAREIENSARRGPISSEVYGDESYGKDEEDLFSGVARDQKPAWNARRTVYADQRNDGPQPAQNEEISERSDRFASENERRGEYDLSRGDLVGYDDSNATLQAQGLDNLVKTEKGERKIDAQKFRARKNAHGKPRRDRSRIGLKDLADDTLISDASLNRDEDLSPENEQKAFAADEKTDEKSAESEAKPVGDQPKKRFSFSAASAKRATFKTKFSGSPSTSFAPIGNPGSSGSASPIPLNRPPIMAFPGTFPAPVPGVIPGPIPNGAMSYGGVVSPPPGMTMPIPFGGHVPSGAMGSPENAEFPRERGPVDVGKLRAFSSDDFNFIAHQEKKDEPVPKIYFTPPTWSNQSSDIWYVDQFPMHVPVPRMQMFMPPMGFMMPAPQY